jgi:hypothetical protein
VSDHPDSHGRVVHLKSRCELMTGLQICYRVSEQKTTVFTITQVFTRFQICCRPPLRCCWPCLAYSCQNRTFKYFLVIQQIRKKFRWHWLHLIQARARLFKTLTCKPAEFLQLTLSLLFFFFCRRRRLGSRNFFVHHCHIQQLLSQVSSIQLKLCFSTFLRLFAWMALLRQGSPKRAQCAQCIRQTILHCSFLSATNCYGRPHV